MTLTVLPLLEEMEMFLRQLRERREFSCTAQRARASKLLLRVLEAKFSLQDPAPEPKAPPAPGSLQALAREAAGLCVTCGGTGRVACDDPTTVGMPCPECSAQAPEVRHG